MTETAIPSINETEISATKDFADIFGYFSHAQFETLFRNKEITMDINLNSTVKHDYVKINQNDIFAHRFENGYVMRIKVADVQPTEDERIKIITFKIIDSASSH